MLFPYKSGIFEKALQVLLVTDIYCYYCCIIIVVYIIIVIMVVSTIFVVIIVVQGASKIPEQIWNLLNIAKRLKTRRFLPI